MIYRVVDPREGTRYVEADDIAAALNLVLNDNHRIASSVPPDEDGAWTDQEIREYEDEMQPTAIELVQKGDVLR